MKKIIIFVIFLAYCFADESVLTLDKVITLSQKPSFNEKALMLELKKTELNLKQINNNYYPNIYLDGRLGKEQNLINGSQELVNDNFAYIVWKNNLYNQKDSIIKNSLYENKKIKNLEYKDAMQKRKLLAMQYFFDTKLAEMYQQYILEVLAMKAIYRNRAADVAHLERVSDIELLEKESALAKASAQNYKAKQNFYLKKQKLTNLLSLDFYAIETIETPDLKIYLNKKIPENNKLQTLALKNDINYILLKQKLQMIQSQIKSYKSDLGIQINTNIMYGIEEQKTPQTDDTRYEANINLKIPLYDSHANDNKVQLLIIEKKKIQNKIEQYKYDLSLKIEQLLVRLNYNKRLLKAASAKLDYRNLYLEKSRLVYQFDKASDLGDSLALLSKAEYEYEKILYDYVMTYENLNLITGVNNENK